MSLKNLIKNSKKHQKKGDHDDDDPHHAKHESHAPHGESEEGWLVSYADMMTLLCGFFIIMFSMAKMDEPKFEKLKEAVSEAMGTQYKAPTEEMKKFVTQLLQEAGIEKETVVRSDAGGVTVVFQSKLFFNTLSASLNPAGKQIIDKLIGAVATEEKKESKSYKIVVEGHTDSRPVLGGVYPSNWELSSARASSVVRMFMDKGFPAQRLTAIGYADTHPEAPPRKPSGEWDEEALGKNRRVVVRILEPNVESIPFPSSSGGFATGPNGVKIPPQKTGAAALTAGKGTGAVTSAPTATATGASSTFKTLVALETPDPVTLAVTAASLAASGIKATPEQLPAHVVNAAQSLGITSAAHLVPGGGAMLAEKKSPTSVDRAPASGTPAQTPTAITAPPAPAAPQPKKSRKKAKVEQVAPAEASPPQPDPVIPPGFDPTKVNLD